MAKTTPSPPKDRATAKQETREALLDAGLAEFSERGFDVPSLDSICARAGYTRGAFYVHFRSREELLEGVMDRFFRAFLDLILVGDAGAGEVEETIARFARLVEIALGARGAAALPIEMHRVLEACSRSARVRDRFVTMLDTGVERVATAVRRAQQAGRIRADVDPARLAGVLAMVAIGTLTAAQIRVPIDVAGTRATVLALLSSPVGATRKAGRASR